MTDNILSCSESPLKCPQLMDMSRIYPCISCSLRLNAQVAGPGNVTKHANGLLLNENTQTTLTVNGIQYNLLESYIYIPGAHRLPGQQEPHPMEVALYFRNDDGQKHIALCIPVQVGAVNPYFAALNETVRNRPTVGSLVSTKGSIISYRGADMRGRTGKDSRPRSQCDTIARTVTYYVVMTPTTIAAADYQRLKTIAKDTVGPPVAITEIIESRYKLLSRINGIKVIDETPPPPNDKGVATNAMKCYRLDKDKDVVNDKVYIGGPGSSLEKELADSDATQADGERLDTSIQPGDIEILIGIIVGIIIGLLIAAYIVYLLWSGTFRDYMKVQRMHDMSWGFKLPAFNPIDGFKRLVCPPPTLPSPSSITK
jgi:hypothetical protein